MAEKSSDREIIKKLETEANAIIEMAKAKKNPKISIPLRGLSNVYFDKKDKIIKLGDKYQTRSFFNIGQAKKFMQTFLVANACKEIIESGKTTSIRDLYYMTKHTIGDTEENSFDEQSESVCPDETLLVRMDGELRLATGYEIIEFAKENGNLIYDANGKRRWKDVPLGVCAFDENYKINEAEAALVMQHPPNKVKKITTSSGRTVKTTLCHSIFTCENGLPKSIEVNDLKKGDWIALPRRLKVDINHKQIDLVRLLIERLHEKSLRNIYLKASPEDMAELFRRIGREELKIFARQYKNVWSSVVANWKHGGTLPLTLLKWSNVKTDDIVPRCRICARGSDKSFKTIIKKDAHLGAVFGFLSSEGAHSVFRKRGKEEGFVSISNKKKELMYAFRDDFTKVFGENSVKAEVLSLRDGMHKLNIGNNTISYILSVLGYEPVNAWDKEVPPVIMDAPDECVKAFLKWFRLGDGSVQPEKLRIRYHTTSKKLVNGMTFLLLRQGIFPRIYTRLPRKEKRHTSYEVRVGSREYTKIPAEITSDFSGMDMENKSQFSGDRIPCLDGMIHDARKASGRLSDDVYKKLPWYSIESQQDTISRGTLVKAAGLLLANSPECAEAKSLLEIANNDICWDQIVSIEDAETPEFTLDIAVRPTQNFIGGDGLLLLHNSDPVIEDIEVSFDALREELHLFASSKGAIVGDITIVDSGDDIDCRKQGSGGHAIPSICEADVIQFKECDAKYVLFIEKDAVWRRFNEDKFWKKHKCIIIHGQGVPPRGVRRLLRRMTEELKLPLYVLVDADPWGLYIYSVIKQGSINLAYESVRMAVPSARFIGLSAMDWEKYKLPKEVIIRLNDEDKRRIKEILKYPWFQKPDWQRELTYMVEKNVKLELEALSRKHISFITDTYLPEKIARKEWLE